MLSRSRVGPPSCQPAPKGWHSPLAARLVRADLAMCLYHPACYCGTAVSNEPRYCLPMGTQEVSEPVHDKYQRQRRQDEVEQDLKHVQPPRPVVKVVDGIHGSLMVTFWDGETWSMPRSHPRQTRHWSVQAAHLAATPVRSMSIGRGRPPSRSGDRCRLHTNMHT